MGRRKWELYSRHLSVVIPLHRAASCLQQSFYSVLVLLSGVSSQQLWALSLVFEFYPLNHFFCEIYSMFAAESFFQSDFCHNYLGAQTSSFCESFGTLSLSQRCLDQYRPLTNFVDYIHLNGNLLHKIKTPTINFFF